MSVSLCCCKDFIRLKLVYATHYRHGRSAYEDFADVFSHGMLAPGTANQNVALKIESTYNFAASFGGIPAINQQPFQHNYSGRTVTRFSRYTGEQTYEQEWNDTRAQAMAGRPMFAIDETGTGFYPASTTVTRTGSPEQVDEKSEVSYQHRQFPGVVGSSIQTARHVYSEDHSATQVEDEANALLAAVDFDGIPADLNSSLPPGITVDDRATIWRKELLVTYQAGGLKLVREPPVVFTPFTQIYEAPYLMPAADQRDGRWVFYSPVGGPEEFQLFPLVVGKCWNGLNYDPIAAPGEVPAGQPTGRTFEMRWITAAKGQLVTGRNDLWIRTIRSPFGQKFDPLELGERVRPERPTEFVLDPDRTGSGPWFGQLLLYDPAGT